MPSPVVGIIDEYHFVIGVTTGGPGTGTSCGKKPIPTDIPIDMDDMEPMPMVKPERPGSDDIKRSLREMLKRLKK